MEDLKNKLAQLLEKSEWTEEDKKWLLEYLEQGESPELRALMFNHFKKTDLSVELLSTNASAEILHNIHEKIDNKKKLTIKPVVSIWYRLAIAAAFIGVCFLITYRASEKTRLKNIAGLQTEAGQNKKSHQVDIASGGNKAVLTLANGSTIVLDDAKNGTLIQQGKTRVLKIDGRLTYNNATTGPDEVAYNTVTTPRGGEYQVLLPDGSLVWLNAASSLKFPTIFKGTERRVEIAGEAYFEVTKNPDMPFIVNVNNSAVKVFGTHFNVMAYGDEELLKTTLLEGSVEFTSGNSKVMLKPGQQSQLIPNGEVKILNAVNTDEVVAWKNGLFHFEKIDAKTMMRQIARWYDVEVVYEARKTDERFYADIPRNTSLLDVLKALELTGRIRFDVAGRKVIVK